MTEETKWPLLDVFSSAKKIIFVFKAGLLCVTHALSVAVVPVNVDPSTLCLGRVNIWSKQLKNS